MDAPVYTREQVEAMQNVDIRTVDPDTLRDIREVKIDENLPKRERMLEFIRQIGNPFCYRHGKYIVKVSYTNTDVTLEQRMLAYIRSKYSKFRKGLWTNRECYVNIEQLQGTLNRRVPVRHSRLPPVL